MTEQVDENDDGLRYGSAPARRDRLRRMVEEQGFLTIAELSRQLAVSEMTIRRDVQRLVNDGRLRSVHGGVSALPQSDLLGSQFSSRAVKLGPEKRAIALEAAKLVPPDGAVGLDSGTTTLELARTWPSDRRATVMTNSIPNLLALYDDESTRVMMLGGQFERRSQTLSGPMSLRSLEDMRLTVMFLSASSLSSRGVYCGNDYDAVTKRALIEIADQVVLLSDSTKFEGSAMVRVCGFDAIDVAVMDDGLPHEQAAVLRGHGIDLRLVKASTESEQPL